MLMGWSTGKLALSAAVADVAVTCALVQKVDWEPEQYAWDKTVFDCVVLSILRAFTSVCAVALQGSSPFLPLAQSIFTGLCAIFSVVKLSAAHGLHSREHKVLFAIWLSLVFSVVEAVFFGVESIGLKIARDRERETRDVDAESNGYHRLNNTEDRYKGTGSSFRRVLSLAWPERYILAVGMVCLVIASASQMIVPTLFGKIIQTISKTKDESELDRTVVMMLVVFTLSSIFAMFRGALFNLAGERLVARFRVRVFDAVISQDVAFFDVSQSGELQSRLSNDSTKIQDAVTSNVSMGLRFLAQVIVGLAILFVISWKLTLIMLSVIPALSFGARVFGLYIRGLSTKYQESLAKGGEVAEQAFSNIRTVRSFSKESHEVDKYKEKIMVSYSFGVKMAWAYGGFLGGIGLFAYFATALVLWYGGKLVIAGNSELDAAKLTAFLLYTIYIAVALGGLTGLYSQLMSAVGASQRMFELIDRQPTVPTDKLSDVNAEKELDSSEIEGKVVFDQVSFSYPSREDVKVLHDISFECAPGQINALVGSSGGGKSTIINLLLRFYDPDMGRVLIDGRDIRTMSTVKLHSFMGVVSQQPTLFSMSIEDNIKYGIHRTVTDEEVKQAAEQANAMGFISKFPDGFKTMVGERGVTLSGGERQRVAIARALLASPKVLLLDEATSALDAESEHLVQEALDRVMVGKTTLVIAHRLSTVRNANCILVVQDGKIAERGTHSELMARKDGLYAALVSRQLH